MQHTFSTDELCGMIEIMNSHELKLFHYELLLNQYSDKRYHLIQKTNGFCALVEIKKLGKEKILTAELSPEQMIIWFKRHLKLKLEASVSKNE